MDEATALAATAVSALVVIAAYRYAHRVIAVLKAVVRHRREQPAAPKHRTGAPLGHRCADCDADPEYHRNGSAHQDLQEWR